jgi:hypothetical protein
MTSVLHTKARRRLLLGGVVVLLTLLAFPSFLEAG